MSNSEQVRSQLGILRENIDKVDAKLLRLLNQRAELVLKVGELKKANNLAVVHADREKVLLARLCEQNSGPLPLSHPNLTHQRHNQIAGARQ